MFYADEDVQTDTLTGTPQPGSLEALKNMLFKLQTEAAAHAAGNPTTIENLQVRVVRNQTSIENLQVGNIRNLPTIKNLQVKEV